MDAASDPCASDVARPTLSLPPASPGYLPRPRLQALFAANPHARLILLCAPAGFGKSTALGELVMARQQQGGLCAWLALGAADDDPARFLQRLIKALRTVLPGLGEDALGYLCNTMHTPVPAVVESLLADLSQLTERLLLVLDDFQVTDKHVLAGLARLIQLAPVGFTLALAARTQPALPLATLRAKGQLLEIGLEDLRLTRQETGEYLLHRGVQLDEAGVHRLHVQTEGWMIGVQLASLLGQKPLASGLQTLPATDQAAVGEYLLCTVFEQLPGELQEALLSLGVASQLNGELASALTGREDGQALLERLEVMQLFVVPLDRERHWYRFHHLFADFLRSRLKSQNPERFRQLHFNASLWFTNHRMQNLAIEHASLAEDSEMLAALVDGYGLELINRGQLNRLYRWRLQVPDAIVARYPVLILADVWDKAAKQALPEANRLLDELLARWSGEADVPLREGYLAALAVKSMLALQKDDLELCVSLARKIEAQLGQHAAFLEVAMLVIGALALVMLAQPEQARRLVALAQQRNHFLEGRYLDMQLGNVEVLLALEQGQLRQAQQLSEQLRARMAPGFGEASPALVLPVIGASLIAYQQGRFAGLEERLRWALQHVDVINPIDLYAQGLLCLARLQRIQGQPKAAQASLASLQNLASRNHSWRFYAQAVGEEIALLLEGSGQDRLKRAEQRLQSVEWERLAAGYARQAFNPVSWVLGLSRVRLHQAHGQYSEALREIAQLQAQLQPGWHGLQRLRLEVLAALSYQRLGYRERAQSTLVQCLMNAEREGACSVFVEEGESVRALLQQLKSAERHPALQGFLRDVLGFWPSSDARATENEPVDELTDRELNVMRLAARGMSNEDIGRQLSLALGTVKWHLHNIYAKLKVRNRTQAIRRARELELLDS